MKEKTIETKNKQEKHIGLQTEKQISSIVWLLILLIYESFG